MAFHQAIEAGAALFQDLVLVTDTFVLKGFALPQFVSGLAHWTLLLVSRITHCQRVASSRRFRLRTLLHWFHFRVELLGDSTLLFQERHQRSVGREHVLLLLGLPGHLQLLLHLAHDEVDQHLLAEPSHR
uniref:(northern house mosquito) hypothetical protein n=1 Tax=Culex pipiens TaxID=7175 RepID=A0A8D8F0K6_CULPI